MIPKIIHYCWFGGNPLPKKFVQNIETWKKYFPDFEFKLWDEKNFEIESVEYVKQAHNLRKWAFVSDYVRLWALYHYGGIYLDTDVEVIKPFDKFLEHEMFLGMDYNPFGPLPVVVGTGIVGSRQEHPVIKDLKDYYDNIKEFTGVDCPINNGIFTQIAEERGLQKNNEFQILRDEVYVYPQEVFCAFNYRNKRSLRSKETFSIHKFEGSWVESSPQSYFWHLKKNAKAFLRTIVGEEIYWSVKDQWSGKK